MTGFEYEKTEKPEGCACCRFETAQLEAYAPAPMSKSRKERWLCRFCAGTMTGTYDEYPQQHDSDSLQIMRTLCYIGNVLLEAIEKKP